MVLDDNQPTDTPEKVDTIMRMVEPNLEEDNLTDNSDGNVRFSPQEAGVKVTVFKKSKPPK